MSPLDPIRPRRPRPGPAAAVAVSLALGGWLGAGPASAAGKKAAPAAKEAAPGETRPDAPPALTREEEEAKVLEVAQRHARRLAAAAADHGAAAARLIEAGGLEPGTMTAPGAVQSRMALLDGWCDRGAAFAQMLATGRQALQQHLLQAGVSEETASSFATRVANSPSRMSMMVLRVNEARTCAAAREQLQLLADHPWRWDPDGQHVVFTNPDDQDAARRHAELGGELAELEAQRARLQPAERP